MRGTAPPHGTHRVAGMTDAWEAYKEAVEQDDADRRFWESEGAYADWGADPSFVVNRPVVTDGVVFDRHGTPCWDCLTAGDLVDADVRGGDRVPYCFDCFPGPTVPIR